MAGGDLLWGREGMEREEEGGKVSTSRPTEEEGQPPSMMRRRSEDRGYVSVCGAMQTWNLSQTHGHCPSKLLSSWGKIKL